VASWDDGKPVPPIDWGVVWRLAAIAAALVFFWAGIIVLAL